MTNYDQAFIRAYARETAGLGALPPGSDAAPHQSAGAVELLPAPEPPTVEELYAPDRAHVDALVPRPHARFFHAADTPAHPAADSAPSEPVAEHALNPPTEAAIDDEPVPPRDPLLNPASQFRIDDKHNTALVGGTTQPPVPTDDALLTPAFQVDEFAWPSVCRQLARAASPALNRIVDELLAASAAGQRVIAWTSRTEGTGRSSLLLATAQRLAKRKRNVVIVDANGRRPALARLLGLQPEVGWREILTAGSPLSEGLIESVTDNLTLLPLVAPLEPADLIDHPRLPEHLDQLRPRYDLVLVDCGPLSDDRSNLLTRRAPHGQRALDAALLVEDARLAPADAAPPVERLFTDCGLAWWGQVQNFAPAA